MAPTAAIGTVAASIALVDQRGAITGAIRSTDSTAEMAAAADDTPSANSEMSSVTRVPA